MITTPERDILCCLWQNLVKLEACLCYSTDRHHTMNHTYMGVHKMEVDLIFKLAALGILVSVLNLLLSRSGRDDYALIVTLAGLLISLLVIVEKVSALFETIRTLFQF